MLDDHFTFLGHRDYELIARDGQFFLRGVAGSGRGHAARGAARSGSDDLTPLPAAARHHRRLRRSSSPRPTRATVHRPGYLDYASA
jgi:glutamate dehydrogenase